MESKVTGIFTNRSRNYPNAKNPVETFEVHESYRSEHSIQHLKKNEQEINYDFAMSNHQSESNNFSVYCREENTWNIDNLKNYPNKIQKMTLKDLLFEARSLNEPKEKNSQKKKLFQTNKIKKIISKKQQRKKYEFEYRLTGRKISGERSSKLQNSLDKNISIDRFFTDVPSPFDKSEANLCFESNKKKIFTHTTKESIFKINKSLPIKNHKRYNFYKTDSLKNVRTKKKARFKKIFDPKTFSSHLMHSSNSKNIQEKFNMFLFLPQLLLLNNLFQSKQTLNKNYKIIHPENIEDSRNQIIFDKNSNISTNSSQKPTMKSTTLTESQKYRKISRKLRRAWNLNQKIPINIFKKQVRYLSTSKNKMPGSNVSLKEESSNTSNVDDKQEKEMFFGMKRKSHQRKSKLVAKNKIKNSMIRQRKQRAPLGEEKEHLEYKRLVGLKRDLGDFLKNNKKDATKVKENKKGFSFENLFLSCSLEEKNHNQNNFFSNLDRAIKTDSRKKATMKSKKSGIPKDQFEYVEFLDFSLKKINKPNFLVSEVNN